MSPVQELLLSFVHCLFLNSKWLFSGGNITTVSVEVDQDKLEILQKPPQKSSQKSSQKWPQKLILNLFFRRKHHHSQCWSWSRQVGNTSKENHGGGISTAGRIRFQAWHHKSRYKYWFETQCCFEALPRKGNGQGFFKLVLWKWQKTSNFSFMNISEYLWVILNALSCNFDFWSTVFSKMTSNFWGLNCNSLKVKSKTWFLTSDPVLKSQYELHVIFICFFRLFKI